MKPILCETCINAEKEIIIETRGFYKEKIETLNYYCKIKLCYVRRREKYKCLYYANITLEDSLNVK